MARHKKLNLAEEEAPKLDVSSLIDCCFLLLAYFICATTLVKEQKIDMGTPGEAQAATPKLEPATVRIESNGTVYWGAGSDAIPLERDPNVHDLDLLFQKLDAVRMTAEGTDQKPVVLLQVRNDVPHQRLIDVMNAMSRAKIKNVGMADTPDDD